MKKAPPLPATPSPDDVKILHQRAIIFGAEAARFQGKFTQLVGAVKQREFSEAQIVAAEKARAAEVDALIKTLNANEAERAKPWFKRVFGKSKD